MFSRGIEISLFVFVPLTLLVLILAPQIVDLAFRRGLFTARDVAPTAMMLRIGVLAVLPGAIVMLIRDLLYASSRTRPLVWGGLIHLSVTSLANLVLAPRHGIAWIAIGVVVGTWLSCAVLFLFVRTRVSRERWREVTRNGGAVILGAVAVAAGARVALSIVPPDPAAGLLRSMWILISAGAAGLLAYVAATALLGHPLARGALKQLRGRTP
jgi:putative peptidoglycan lipid II flippase